MTLRIGGMRWGGIVMFKVGDVVVRIGGISSFDLIPIGGIRRVSNVWYWDGDDEPGEALDFFGHPPDHGWYAEIFAKLPPAEPEFIQLIRSLKAPTKIREDA